MAANVHVTTRLELFCDAPGHVIRLTPNSGTRAPDYAATVGRFAPLIIREELRKIGWRMSMDHTEHFCPGCAAQIDRESTIEP